MAFRILMQIFGVCFVGRVFYLLMLPFLTAENAGGFCFVAVLALGVAVVANEIYCQ